MAKVYTVTGEVLVASLGHTLKVGDTVREGHPALDGVDNFIEVAESHEGPVTYEHEPDTGLQDWLAAEASWGAEVQAWLDAEQAHADASPEKPVRPSRPTRNPKE